MTTSFWIPTATKLPPQHHTILIRTTEGYVFTSRLHFYNNRWTWKMNAGAWPIDRVVAWAEIPPLDCEIPKPTGKSLHLKHPPAPPVVAERG